MSDFDEVAAEAYGTEPDPLRKLHDETEEFEELLGMSIFDSYDEKILSKSKKKDATKEHHRRSYRDWQQWMAENTNRHPTLPSEQNIRDWIDHLLEGVSEGVAADKINHVKAVYEWLQQKRATKHPTNYNPFTVVKSERDLEEGEPDEYPHLSLDDLREQVHSIKHVGERAATVFQLKTGVRSTELANIRLEDIHLTNAEVLAHYDGRNGQENGPMGSHKQLDGISNAVYIPPDKQREGNKRQMPTIIPLDEETRRILIDWLLIRPDNASPYVFLTQRGKKLERTSLRYVWTKHWHPEYEFDGDDDLRSISPHYARHWFSTWLRTKANMPELHVQYLRGDRTGPDIGTSRSAIHRYIHTYYEDVEHEYRNSVFKLNL